MTTALAAGRERTRRERLWRRYLTAYLAASVAEGSAIRRTYTATLRAVDDLTRVGYAVDDIQVIGRAVVAVRGGKR